jgi:hypothetical protein
MATPENGSPKWNVIEHECKLLQQKQEQEVQEKIFELQQALDLTMEEVAYVWGIVF